MDFSTFNLEADADKGAEMVVLHPVTGEETDAKIVLKGADSPDFRAAKAKVAERFMGAKKKVDREKVANDVQAEILAAVTVSWVNIKDGKEALECNAKNAKALYAKHAWLRDQIDGFVSDRANFFGNA